jgi:hypothetical protein
MASTDVEVANLALLRIGQKTVTAISASSTALEERIAYAIFDEVRDEYYALEDWDFARKYADLVGTGTDPDDTDYDYEYTLPNDFVEFRGFQEYIGKKQIIPPYLWIDEDEVTLIYTWQQTDYSQLSSVYLQALVALLSMRFAEGLALKAEIITRAERNWFTAYQRARVNLYKNRDTQNVREQEADVITDR